MDRIQSDDKAVGSNLTAPGSAGGWWCNSTSTRNANARQSRGLFSTTLRWMLGLVVAVVGCSSASDTPKLAGGGAASNPDKPLVVGFAQIGAESSWRTAETKSIRGEAEKRGITLKFADAQGKPEAQIAAVRAFIAQQVSAIIIAPAVETGWEPVLKEAKRANIPVVLVDRGIKVSDDSLYATLIASDFVAEGRRVGEWLAEKLGGKGNIVELQGTTGSAPANDRKKGFAEAIAKFPDLKIIKSQSADFNMANGKNLMATFLNATEQEGVKIDAVYAHNDDMALGAIEAITDAKLSPGKDVIVCSIDGVKGALESLSAGKLNCTVECNPLLGPVVFDAIDKLLRGEALPKSTLVDDRIFSTALSDEELAQREY